MSSKEKLARSFAINGSKRIEQWSLQGDGGEGEFLSKWEILQHGPPLPTFVFNSSCPLKLKDLS